MLTWHQSKEAFYPVHSRHPGGWYSWVLSLVLLWQMEMIKESSGMDVGGIHRCFKGVWQGGLGKAVELSGEDGDKRQVSAFPSGTVWRIECLVVWKWETNRVGSFRWGWSAAGLRSLTFVAFPVHWWSGGQTEEKRMWCGVWQWHDIYQIFFLQMTTPCLHQIKQELVVRWRM